MNPHIDYLMTLAVEYIQKGDLDGAERLLKQALKMAPKNSEIFRLLGITFAFKKKLEDAIGMFDRSIKIDPNNWLAFSNKGNALKELNQHNLALKNYDRSIILRPDYAEVYNNKGNVLYELGRFQDSVDSYEKAISLLPSYADAFHGKGNALKRFGDFQSALDSYEMAAKCDPTAGYMLSSLITMKMQLCSWDQIQRQIDELYKLGLNSPKKIHPFHLLPICDDPNLLLELTRRYMRDNHPELYDLGSIIRHPPHKKIHVGYFSPDLRNHAVSFLIAGMLEAHDKNRFELFAFSMGCNKDDEIRESLKPNFKEFIDISEMSDIHVAQLARNMGIDIAVDLGGLTQDARPGIFSYRAAPIQIGYIGYLGTMAAPYMDYIVADKVIIPAELRGAYSEKVMYLQSYHVNDSKRKVAEKIFTREELGLPLQGVIYCCFNNNFKITSSILDSWALILKSVEGSVIFLHAENMIVRKNLLAEFEARSIENSRIIFAERIPRDEYLARYQLADIFLDTSPYNAGTTASDALWAGIPVVTFVGKSFSSRMGSGLLNSVGLAELVGSTQQEYESIAIELGQNRKMLREIKEKLAKNRLNTPLFDAKLFTRDLESAYEKAYARFQDGLLPEHIE